MVASATDLEQAIREFAESLETGIRIEAIVLYGSYARGTAYDQSDIDIAVVSPDFEGLPVNRRQDIIARLERHTDPRISPIGYPTSEYHNPSPPSCIRSSALRVVIPSLDHMADRLVIQALQLETGLARCSSRV
jgi:predicted nucleotidyltransferase